MTSWIGPAIVAAVISAMVTGIGWYVSERQTSRREAARRRERIVDVQTAIFAEIRAGKRRIGDVRNSTAEVYRILREQPDFTPFVPRQAPSFVFDALISDVHILPNAVIDPVVIYYRQLAAISLFIEDLRSDRFAALDSDRKRAMYHDYAELLLYADILGTVAEAVLGKSLNMTAEDLSDPKSASGPDAASAPVADSRSGS